MSDKARKVDRDGCGGDLFEKWSERDRRAAVGSLDDGGHTLVEVVCGVRHLENAATTVRMDVDEAGCYGQAFCINLQSCFCLGKMSNGSNCVTTYRDIPVKPGISGAIKDLPVLNQ